MGKLCFTLEFEGDSQKAARGQRLLVQPQLFTQGGLLINTGGCQQMTSTEPGSTARLCLRTLDADGRFELPDAELGTGFLVISHEGFHTFGERLKQAGERSIELIRFNDPAPQRPRVTTPFTENERRGLALRLLEPLLKDGDDDSRARALQVLTAIDLERTLDELEKNPFKNSQHSDMVRSSIVRRLAKDRSEEALAVAEAIGFTVFRAQSMVHVADSLGDEQRAQKLKILA